MIDETKEEWKWIAAHEGSYSVSSFGRVRCHDRIVPDSIGRNRKRVGQILKPIVANNRYLEIRLGEHWTKRKGNRIHRLVACAFIPNPSNKPQVNHKDGNRANNHISNLEWVTCSENHRHAFDVLGRKMPWDGKPGRKRQFSDEQVRGIRESRDTLSPKEAAAHFGTTDRNIWRIRTRQSYKYLP